MVSVLLPRGLVVSVWSSRAVLFLSAALGLAAICLLFASMVTVTASLLCCCSCFAGCTVTVTASLLRCCFCFACCTVFLRLFYLSFVAYWLYGHGFLQLFCLLFVACRLYSHGFLRLFCLLFVACRLYSHGHGLLLRCCFCFAGCTVTVTVLRLFVLFILSVNFVLFTLQVLGSD